MDQESIQEKISTIEYEWSHLTKEPDNEPEYFHFISIKAIALTLRIHELLAILTKQFETDKNIKISYQMLANSLEKMESILDFKAKVAEDLDSEYIKMVLAKIKSIEPEMEVLRKHITC